MFEKWYRTDEREDVIGTLEELHAALTRLPKHAHAWKTSVILAISAVTGALVCFNYDSTETGALDDKSAAEELNRLSSTTPGIGRGKLKLADLKTLLKRSLDEKRVPNRGQLSLAPGQCKKIMRLHTQFRNEFEHFKPHGWSIEMGGMPDLLEAAAVAAHDAMSNFVVTIFLDDTQLRRLDEAHSHIIAELARLRSLWSS